MTKKQKLDVSALRRRGLGYRKIAARTGISENTVKAYISRNCAGNGVASAKETPGGVCLHCGAVFTGEKIHKRRKFCSDACRRAWWKQNDILIDRRAWRSHICAACGKEFRSYGNGDRKYCGHNCYVNDRFKKGANPV